MLWLSPGGNAEVTCRRLSVDRRGDPDPLILGQVFYDLVADIGWGEAQLLVEHLSGGGVSEVVEAPDFASGSDESCQRHRQPGG